MPELDELLERSAPRTTPGRGAALDESLRQLSDEARNAAGTRSHVRRVRWLAGGVACLLLLGGTTAAAAATPVGQQVVAQLTGSVPQATAVTMRCTQRVVAAPGTNAADPAVTDAVRAAQTWFQDHANTETWITTAQSDDQLDKLQAQATQLEAQSAQLEDEYAAHEAAEAARGAAARATASGTLPSLPAELSSSLSAAGLDPALVAVDGDFCNSVDR